MHLPSEHIVLIRIYIANSATNILYIVSLCSGHFQFVFSVYRRFAIYHSKCACMQEDAWLLAVITKVLLYGEHTERGWDNQNILDVNAITYKLYLKLWNGIKFVEKHCILLNINLRWAISICRLKVLILNVKRAHLFFLFNIFN